MQLAYRLYKQACTSFRSSLSLFNNAHIAIGRPRFCNFSYLQPSLLRLAVKSVTISVLNWFSCFMKCRTNCKPDMLKKNGLVAAYSRFNVLFHVAVFKDIVRQWEQLPLLNLKKLETETKTSKLYANSRINCFPSQVTSLCWNTNGSFTYTVCLMLWIA